MKLIILLHIITLSLVTFLPIFASNDYLQLLTIIATSVSLTTVAVIRVSKKLNFIFIITVFFTVYVGYFNVINSYEYISILSHRLILIACLLIIPYLNFLSITNLRSILVFSIILIFITSLTTIYNVIFYDPNISRYLAKSGEMANISSSRNVGGYGFIYSVLLVYPSFLYLLNIFKNKYSVYYLLTICLCILIVVTIILAKYFIALLAIVIISLFYLLIIKEIKQKFVLFTLLALSLYIINTFYPLLIVHELKIKMIDEFATNIQYGREINQSRYDHYETSIITFLNNPVIGSQIFNFDIIGFHSEFFDLLAEFGLLSGILFIILIIYPFIQLLKHKKNSDKKMFILMTIFSILWVNIFNKISFDMIISFYLSYIIYTKISYTLNNGNRI